MKTTCLILMLTGCGSGVYRTECTGVDGYGTVYAEDPGTNCGMIRDRVLSAHKMIVAVGIWKRAELLYSTSGTTLSIREYSNFSGPNGASVGGYTQIGRIDVGAGIAGLLHEEIHLRQIEALDITTGTHAGWDDNGWLAVGEFSSNLAGIEQQGGECYRLVRSQVNDLRSSGFAVDEWLAGRPEGCRVH